MQSHGTNLEQSPHRGTGLRRWGLVLALVAILVALPTLIGGGWAVYRAVSQETLARDLVPGTLTFTVDKPGDYSIFYEHRSIIGGRHITGPTTPPTFDLSLTDARGNAIDIEPYRANYTYETPSYQGMGLYWFHIAQPGDFTLEVTTRATGDFVLAVGETRLGLILSGILGLLTGCMFLVLFGVGVILFIIGLTMRDNRSTHPSQGIAG